MNNAMVQTPTNWDSTSQYLDEEIDFDTITWFIEVISKPF